MIRPTIPMPTRINTGFRDPVRAFNYNDKWYVGVGCGNKAEGAQFCLFEADDDTLAKFTDRYHTAPSHAQSPSHYTPSPSIP